MRNRLTEQELTACVHILNGMLDYIESCRIAWLTSVAQKAENEQYNYWRYQEAWNIYRATEYQYYLLGYGDYYGK